MSSRNALSAITRCSMPSDSLFHSAPEMMRGTMSNGISRSAASASP